jgi:hypothetical protein
MPPWVAASCRADSGLAASSGVRKREAGMAWEWMSRRRIIDAVAVPCWSRGLRWPAWWQPSQFRGQVPGPFGLNALDLPVPAWRLPGTAITLVPVLAGAHRLAG